ncbi:hypothetical protein L1987_07751 [Smallanthus sonchifolius]|uniref:Uncharacterized protein n=1 Tax=Smallanthus sonchifolius TaxID=185202 RepID=A0ACB9JI58_9ASTR|nr:hypothetical protein L1987_07751 [Smallanthus sonchifolius]
MHASIKRTAIVEASPNLYPLDPMIEDGPIAAQPQTVGTVKAADQGVTETENLSEPGGTHINGEGRTYGISDSHRKAIAERLSVSNSICSEETVNWCPGEWDYFNDLCISLGLDPDYCIEDVESDTENGTTQFFSDLMKSGRPNTNHWPLNGFVGCDIWTVWDMGQQKTIFCLLWSWLANSLKPMWVLFWHFRVDVMAQKDSPKCDIRFIREEAHVGVSLGKPMALFSAHFLGPMHGCLDIQLLYYPIDSHACALDPVEGGIHSSLGTNGGNRASDGNPISNGSRSHREAQQVSMPKMVEISCFPPVGESTVLDTEMDGLKHPSRSLIKISPAVKQFPSRVTKFPVSYQWKPPFCSHCVTFGHSLQQCKNKPRPMEEVESTHPSISPPSPVLETVTGGLSATPAVTKQRAPIVNEDGFTTVTRRKKVGPIKVQGRKQKTVRVKAATQQYKHVRPTSRQASAGLSEKQMGKAPQVNQGANNHGVLKTPTMVPNATKKVSSGFNFARAVQDDLYPSDQSVKDGMDLDVIRPKDGQIEECQSNQKRVGDLFLGSESMVCQMNREHIEGVRVLPASVLSSPGLGGSLSTSPFLLGPGHSGKSYGISEEQKRAIADRLKSTGSISMDIVDQWCPGQWDFFNDHCTLMGLDPDYCIEDVESDTENGTAQFFSAQMKVGMPKVPSSNQPPPLNESSFHLSRAALVKIICNLLVLGSGSHSAWIRAHQSNLFISLGIRKSRRSRNFVKVEVRILFKPMRLRGGPWPTWDNSMVSVGAVPVSPVGCLFWNLGCGTLADWDMGLHVKKQAQDGIFLRKPIAFHSAHSKGPLFRFLVILFWDCNLVNSDESEVTPPSGVHHAHSPDSAKPRDEDFEADGISGNKPRKSSSTRRGSPYAKPVSSGPIRSTGTRAGRKDRHLSRYTPSLADLRVKEFIRETAEISPMEVPLSMKFPQSDNLGIALTCNLVTNDGMRVSGESYTVGVSHPQGGLTGGDTTMYEMNLDIGKMMDFAYDRNLSPQLEPGRAVQSVWNSPISASAAAQKKAAPAADQNNNTQCVGPGTAPRPTSYKPKNVSTGFNYSRAVQGGKASSVQHSGSPPVAADRTEPWPPSHSTAPLVSGISSASMSRAMDIDTSNRFSVLDIPSSIKFNKLVESHDDLYPPDQGLVDGMDVDPNRPKCRDNEVCQLNREHAVVSRILPVSITSPHLSGENSSSFLIGPGCSGKSYGISDEQKTIIATRLKNEGSVSVDIVDQWCPGQWDYFNDLCTIMGLDPDYCIEDVESDDENGTAQFFAAQMKVGMPKMVSKLPNFKFYGELKCGGFIDSRPWIVINFVGHLFWLFRLLRWATYGSECLEGQWAAREFSIRDTNLSSGPNPRDIQKPNSKYIRSNGGPTFAPDLASMRTARATPSGQGTNPIEVVDPKHSSSELNKGGTRSREEPNLSSGQGMGCSMSIPAAGGPRKSFSDPTKATAMETSDPFMEGSTPVPSSTAYGTHSPRRDGSATQAIIWDAPNSQFSPSERSSMRDDDNSGTTEVVINPKGYQALHAVNTTNDPGVDSEGFTVVNRRKKRNGIKVQNKKQKSVMIKPINQQNKHSQKHDMLGNKVSGYNIGTQSVSVQKDTSNQVNAKSQAGIQNSGGRKSKGFDFSRAINGSVGTPKPAQHVHKSSTSVSRSPSDRSPTGPVLEVNGTGCRPLSPPCSSTVSGSGTSPCGDHFAPIQHGSNTSQQPKPLVANQ